MSSSLKTFYKVLEVDSEASPEVIEAAYRRLARRYHPDLNPNKDATAKMQELNEAFSVLSDVQKRMSYDLHLRTQADAQARRTNTTNTSSEQPRSNSNPTPRPEPASRATQANPTDAPNWAMATACEKCGRSDASLRFAQFPYVVSVILITFRRGDGGLFCSRCRQDKMSTAKGITFLLGWWGIPWGPIYSLGVLFTSGEGVIDAKLNADYLRYLGSYFMRIGNMIEAKSAIQASLDLYHDPELAATAHSIFGNGLMPSQAKPKQKWVISVILVVFVACLLIAAVLGSQNNTTQVRETVATIDTTRSIVETIPSPSARVEEWSQLKSTMSPVELDYPSTWKVNDAEEVIELISDDQSLMVFSSPNNTEAQMQSIIDASKSNTNFAKNYESSIRDYLGNVLQEFGGSIVSLSSPIIKDVGDYSVIYNNVTYYEKISNEIQRKRMLLYFFDCGSYLCQVIYSKGQATPFTEDQQQISEHIIASIKIITNASTTSVIQPAPPPMSTQSLSSADVFSELSFCYENEFSAIRKHCSQHHDIFTGIVEKIYVSWNPSKNYEGETFVKKWYIDGTQFLVSESASEYGHLEVDTRTSLKPGKYLVELYVGDLVVASGSFEIR